MIKFSSFMPSMNKKNIAEVAKEANKVVTEVVAPKVEKALPKTVQNTDGSLTRVLSNGNKVEIYHNNGVTTRKVYAPNGERILEDTKKFSTEQVGNKTIKTKEVNRKTNPENLPEWQKAFSYKAERVYKDNKLVGMRETETAPYELYKGNDYRTNRVKTTCVTKSYVDPNRKVFDFYHQKYLDIPAATGYVKVFNGEGNAKRVVDKKYIPDAFANVTRRENGAGGFKPAYNMGLRSYKNGAIPGFSVDQTWRNVFIRYNKKGLPKPAYIGSNGVYSKYTDKQFDNMSLKEMRLATEQYQPSIDMNNRNYGAIYSPRSRAHLNLQFLDEPYPNHN